MWEIVIAVLSISAIGAGLAALLVLSEKYIANYGECKININDDKELNVQGGNTLLEELTNEKIFIPSACGGKGTCGYCKVKVKEGAGPLLPTEKPFLTKEEIEDNVRLSCQVKVRDDLDVSIPQELLEVQEYVAECIEINDLTHDIREFKFKLTEPKEIKYTPGQYIQLLTPEYEKSSEEVYRAYSMSSDPADKSVIELVIRYVPGGICTTYCFEYLQVGDEMKMNGPYGEFHLTDTDAPILFIAGGSGMAPIKCILHHMKNTDNQRKATYFFGANKVKELFYLDLMEQFEEDLPNFEFVPVVAQPEEDEQWDGQTGLVTEALERSVDSAGNCEAYLCGSPGMIDAAVEVLNKLGVTEDRIFYDKFA